MKKNTPRNYLSFWLAMVCTWTLLQCTSRTAPPLSGEEPVTFRDFVDSFNVLSLPFTYADTALTRKKTDTIRISHSVFARFVPDSVMQQVFGKKSAPRLYPLGRTRVEKEGQYLFVKAFNGNERALVLLYFNKEDSFRKAMVALRPDAYKSTTQELSVDRRGTLSQKITRKNGDGSVNEGTNVYAYYPDTNSFTLIMTDPLNDETPELINPIDTLPATNRYSADYVRNKSNLVSVRDGTKPGKLMFFVHFEQSKDCSGELKGEMTLQGANRGLFRKQGDPCGLEFLFRSGSVTVREMTGCGNYRGINCKFDGTYPRSRQTRKKKASAGK